MELISLISNVLNFRCQEDDDEPSPLVQKILDILYATEVNEHQVWFMSKVICNCVSLIHILIVYFQDGFAPPDEVPPEEEEY